MGVGFTGAELWTDWLRNDLDQLSGVVHRESLLLGDSFVMVWADPQGRPKVTVESAKQVAVQRDPGTREITAAVKRWKDAGVQPKPKPVEESTAAAGITTL